MMVIDGVDTKGKRTPEGYKENEFNHWTKEYLAEELKRNGFKVIDCSPSRLDNSLNSRVEIANNANANIFISIHYNALKGIWGKHGGIETYCYSLGDEGEQLATKIHKYLLQGTKLRDRGVKEANFYLLRNTKMPAVLVECGFMDNKKEAALMKTEKYRKECAIEICKGVCEYFDKKYISDKNFEKKTGFKITKKCISILNQNSDYAGTWIQFIKDNPKYNLSGLIEKIYEKDGNKDKYLELLEVVRKIKSQLKDY